MPKNRGCKTHFFPTTSQLNGNCNGPYLRKETWSTRAIKCAGNYNGSPTPSQDVMNFGPQTA